MNSQETKPGAMPLIIQRDGNWNSLPSAINEIAAMPKVKGIMVLACEKNGEVPENFDAFLRGLSIPIFGGVFPGLIADYEHLAQGNIVLGLRSDLEVYIVPSLSAPTFDYDDWLLKSIPPETMIEAKTMFVFVDGLMMRVESLMEALFNTFGLQGNFIGGGAGSLVTPNLRCLITSQGVIRDAAILAIPRMHSYVSVAHGWRPIAGPFEITSAENNVIATLDWEPALDVYRRALGDVTSPFDFSATARFHPFGIGRLNMEFVMRDIIASSKDGGLAVIGNAPRGALVHVMSSSSNDLISAATQARARINANAIPEGHSAVDIVMDCISRVSCLGDKLENEIAALRHQNLPLIGAFSIGEIANSGQEYLEFYNKTVVIATIWE